MTATHSSEVMSNLNPVTKKYLQQIEKAYQKANNGGSDQPIHINASPGSPDPVTQKEMYEKYKAMRDTAIDIGKWINQGYQKGKEDGLTATKYGTPFMEQRLNRNGITSSNNGQGRNASYGRPGLYNKSSPLAGAVSVETPE